MNTSTYPAMINEILEELNNLDNPTDWEYVYHQYANKEMTEALCYDCDFIVLLNDEIYLFGSNEQTCEWSVLHVGQPVIWVDLDPEEEVEIVEELKHEFPGTEIRIGSGESEFMRTFDYRIHRIYDVIAAARMQSR